MDTTKPADALRAKLRAAGVSARQVSVRHSHYSMGSSIYVTIRDSNIEKAKIKEIAGEFEHVSYDQYTGEILSGGNQYLDVMYSGEAAKFRMSKYIVAVTEAAAKLDPAERNRLEKIAGTEYFIGLNSNGCAGYSVWSEHTFVRNAYELEGVAAVLAGL